MADRTVSSDPDSAVSAAGPRWTLSVALAFWALATVTALSLRPLLPVDETRYLSVAWEMWWRHEFLVPVLNGEAYHGKPPLLFWLIHLVWSVTGVSETAARVIPALFAAASLPLATCLARALWPDRPEGAAQTAVILIAMPLFMLFATLVMFDVPLTFFVLLGMVAVVRAARDGSARWWWLFGFALGAAILTKGPVAILHLLPAALLAPLWAGDLRGRGWRGWYLGLGLSVLGGLAIGLAWAVPAVFAAGSGYGSAVLWKETAGRITRSFAHARAWWFYLAVLPAVLYPWGWMPGFWRGLWSCRGRRDLGVRFCLAWALPAFVVLSAVSGKQIHYLIPLVPAFALLASRLLCAHGSAVRAADLVLPSALPVALGLVLVLFSITPLTFLPVFPRQEMPSWVTDIPGHWGVFLIAGAVLLSIPAVRRAPFGAVGAAANGLLIFVVLHAAGHDALFRNYDLRAVSAFLAAHDGVEIAYNKDYEGEFGFLGRLKRKVELVYDEAIPSWVARHNGAAVILRYKEAPRFVNGAPAFEQQYRGHWIGIWIVPRTGNASTTAPERANAAARH